MQKNKIYMKALDEGKIRKITRVMIHHDGTKQEIKPDGQCIDLSDMGDSDVESHLTFESYFIN